MIKVLSTIKSNRDQHENIVYFLKILVVFRQVFFESAYEF